MTIASQSELADMLLIIMYWEHDHTEPITAEEFSERLNTDKQAILNALQELWERGLIDTKPTEK